MYSLRLSAVAAAAAFASLLTVVGAHAQPGPAPGTLSPEQREEIWRRMTPEQRENLWRQMTPDQKGNVIRQLTPEQRDAIRERMTPEQREQFRQRMMERRDQRMLDGGAHRLSPEERQRLREQIYESNRGFGGPGEGPRRGGGQRGKEDRSR
jgi:Spy/CpxP family protein refolding chaperone